MRRSRVGLGPRWRTVAALLALAWGSADLSAQLSPGKLSRAHASLEGSGNCLECHSARSGVDRSACLDCHGLLAERIAAGLGLHANAEYRSCETCHIEHHGIDFELVWWGEAGEASFDHDLAGYSLEGAHLRVGRESGCRSCHRAEFVKDHEVLLSVGKALDRTFLGLDTACLSCHEDAHRGQVGADSCLTCHDLEAWEPASGFEHAETAFPLHGRHREVACSGCHDTLEQEADHAALVFRVDRFASCSDCHRDPHEGRLGSDCATCHSTAGWVAELELSSFDHDRTRFSLRGAHESVSCSGCHEADRGYQVARFRQCTDCHGDPHRGQLESVVGGDGCVACHSVERFVPSEFSLAAHQDSAYPLQGAHLAVACLSCHREISFSELQAHWPIKGGGLLERVRQFRFASTTCVDCHVDPHEGELLRWQDEAGCEACHVVSGWAEVGFDHERTEFPLRGGHEGVTCAACHDTRGGEALSVFSMTGASKRCSSCHGDPHTGQFSARLDGCEGCHEVSGWREVVFDHDRDSRFPLVGAHVDVECASCHPVEFDELEQPFLRYRPLDHACQDCHT